MVKGNMTKDQAYKALLEGKKVCRSGFSRDEYIYMEGQTIKSEEGYNFNGWWRDIEPTFWKSDDNLDWYLFKE